MIYFIKYGDTGIMKIGFATTMKSRMTALQVSSPEPLTLEALIPGTMAQEQSLHRALRDHCKRGEWFRPTALVRLIAEMAIIGRSADDLIAYAKNADQPDAVLHRERHKTEYARYLQDETLPDLWRERYRKWLREIDVAEMAELMLADDRQSPTEWR